MIVFWILFENVMSLHRTKATFVGLFDLGRVNEWVVTEKLGSALKRKYEVWREVMHPFLFKRDDYTFAE